MGQMPPNEARQLTGANSAGLELLTACSWTRAVGGSRLLVRGMALMQIVYDTIRIDRDRHGSRDYLTEVPGRHPPLRARAAQRAPPAKGPGAGL